MDYITMYQIFQYLYYEGNNVLHLRYQRVQLNPRLRIRRIVSREHGPEFSAILRT